MFPRRSIILCPVCHSNLVSITSTSIRCEKCNKTILRSEADLHYDLRHDSIRQQRSLLIHEEDSNDTTSSLFAEFNFRVFIENLRSAMNTLKPERVVDVGSGNGAYSDLLKDYFNLYVGIEPSDIPFHRKLDRSLNDKTILLHADPDDSLPIEKCSTELVTFIASYDHFPDRKRMVLEAARILRPGGYLLVAMTNYNFWLKRVLNFVFMKKTFRHADDHFCVHSPDTITHEISNYSPVFSPSFLRADFCYIPNLPQKLSFIYFNKCAVRFLNFCLMIFVRDILHLRNAGSSMIVVFQKNK